MFLYVETDSSCQDYFFILWTSSALCMLEGDLDDNGQGTNLPPGVDYKLLEYTACGLPVLGF